jgi:hypothetical protein
MKSLSLNGIILGFILAGCGQSQLPVAPTGASGPSWMTPNASTQTLLYVTDSGANHVNVYSYPSGALAGKLTGFQSPSGDCSDKAGNVWIVNALSSNIDEYAHGGTKAISTLKLSSALNLIGCAVDSTSGNLAVTNIGPPGGRGAVWVYTDAKGTPEEYTSSVLENPYFCSYDTEGDLFVDGLDPSGHFVLFELPHGGTALEEIKLNQSVVFPGGVQVGASYVVIGDQRYQNEHESAIYEFSISGTTGTLKGTTVLSGSCDVVQFHVASTAVIAPDACRNLVRFYKYPAGGTATKTLRNLQDPTGAAISVPQGSGAETSSQ